MAYICRYCKRAISPDARVCPHCKRLNINTCSVCGTRIYNDEKYCPGCGTPILVACENCGELIYKGEVYCPYCGSKNQSHTPSGKPVEKKACLNTVSVSLPLPPVNAIPYGIPSPYGGTMGAPIVLPPVMLDAPVEEKKEEPEEEPKRILRTRPAPEVGPTAPRPITGVRVGSVGLILSLLSLFFLFPTVIFPFISLIVSAVGIHKDKKNGRGIAPGVIGLIISLILVLAIIAAVVWGVFFGGWNLVVDKVLSPAFPDVVFPTL